LLANSSAHGETKLIPFVFGTSYNGTLFEHTSRAISNSCCRSVTYLCLIRGALIVICIASTTPVFRDKLNLTGINRYCSLNTLTISLFPLNTVLFPGGPLPLRIFEPRYLDMVSKSLKHSQPFGVCLIREGDETGRPAEPHPIGTFAHIVDWDQLSDGLLGITARGGERFFVNRYDVGTNQLLVG